MFSLFVICLHMQKSIDPHAPTGFTSGLRPFTSKIGLLLNLSYVDGAKFIGFWGT